MAKSDYEVQLEELEKEKDAALDNVDKTYSDQIAQTDAFYNSQIDAVRDYKQTQSAIQQEQTDLTIGQIQQQKEQTQKDYTKEQSAAYVDFKKQTDPHGVNAEQIAAGGMWGSGYSESAQTAMYNEYQNRVATAKASLDQAVVNYNNAMAQAQLQNSSVLAEIAFNAFTQELELTMQAFTSRNALLDAQASAREQVESNYLSAVQQLQESQYNAKPSTSDAFTKWVTYLQNEYSDGYISDASLWKELADTYGETALKQAGFSNTAPSSNYIAGAGNGTGAGFTTTNGVFIPTGGVVGHYQPGKTSAEKSNAQSTGSSLEDQLSKLGLSAISPQELMRRIESGEIIMTQHADGTYTLEKSSGKKGTSGVKTNGKTFVNKADATLGIDKVSQEELALVRKWQNEYDYSKLYNRRKELYLKTLNGTATAEEQAEYEIIDNIMEIRGMNT